MEQIKNLISSFLSDNSQKSDFNAQPTHPPRISHSPTPSPSPPTLPPRRNISFNSCRVSRSNEHVPAAHSRLRITRQPLMNGTGSRFKSSAGSRINQLDSSPHQDSQKTIAVEEVGYATADLDVVETDDLLRKKISDSEHEQQPLPTQQRKSTRATDPISSSPRLPPTRLPTEKTRSRLSSPEDNLLPSERDLWVISYCWCSYS